MRAIKDNDRLAISFTFLLILGISVSCSTVFFDLPQPVDSRNMKSVPSKIQGTWRNVNNDYEESIKIDKTSYTKVTREKYWVSTIKAKTSEKYLFKDGKIFVTDDGSKTGYSYEIKNDTIYFDQQQEESLVLSDSVLLRSAKNCYVLNLKKRNWWEIIFIQRMKNGEIRIIYPVPDYFMPMKTQFNISVLDSTRRDTTFYRAEFKAKEIEKVIPVDESGVLYLLRPDSTFTTAK
jgi:hypothetical protein